MVNNSRRNSICIRLCSCIILFFGFYWVFNNKSKIVRAEANEVYVSYSTDSNYIFPTLVSMTSLMENSDKKTFCKFYILHNEISNNDKEKLNSISKKYKNCNVNLIDVKNEFANSFSGRWAVPTYFRLLLPNILKDQGKCMYLDGDTIIRHDLSEMFKTDMSDFYIAGVHDGYAGKEGLMDYYLKTLRLNDLDSYICAGVLLMNLEKMRKDDISTSAKNLVLENDKEKKLRCLDQDILNKICYGYIKLLPFEFGMPTHVLGEYSEKVYKEKLGISADEFNRMKSEPTIVHFTGGKPWNKIKIYDNVEKFCNEWWDYAKKTDYFEEIKGKYPLGKDIKI